MIQKLLAPDVQKFIKDHEKDDPFSLILKNKSVGAVPIKVIAAQIAARKKASLKLPEWHHGEGIIYPPLISMEQCSSEATARYKATLVSGNVLFDLTGGSGVDTFYLSSRFKKVFYVEQNKALAQIADHNLRHQLGAHHIECINDTAEAFLHKTDAKADIIYLDPARRDQHAQKVFHLRDCTPDVVKLLPLLLDKSGGVLIKTSPMLDIQLAIKTLQYVQEVHIISVANECKEVLYWIQNTAVADPGIVAVNLKRDGTKEIYNLRKSAEATAQAKYALPGNYLYEPNSSIRKAGAFQLISAQFNVFKLHQHTHLYTSASEIRDFPGRRFKIIAVVSYHKKAVSHLLPDKKANITTRNFPDEVKVIKKKLGLKDGGDKFIFAFTDLAGNKRIAITEKLN